MARWGWMLGGWIVWAAHFLGVYVIASVADVVSHAADPAWRMGGLAFSALCLIACAVLGALAVRRLRRHDPPEPHGFVDQIAALSAGMSAVAVAWQALPTLIGY